MQDNSSPQLLADEVTAQSKRNRDRSVATLILMLDCFLHVSCTETPGYPES